MKNGEWYEKAQKSIELKSEIKSKECDKMRLFTSDARVYFAEIMQNIKNEIDRMSDHEITTCDFQEWIDYLKRKYEVAPIILFENNIVQSLEEIQLKKYNPFKAFPGEPDYYMADGVRIIYSIPFDGERELFELQPSKCIMIHFESYRLVSPCGEECGRLVLALEFTKDELENQGDGMADYVTKKFNYEFSSYKDMINYINIDVSAFNNGLEKNIGNWLKKRKNKATSFATISQKLEIPIQLSPNAPNTKPIPLKRINRVPVSKPPAKALVPEYCISDDNYNNINNIIAMYGTTMEETARTYYRNNEEELRDHILAALNTHYQNATGETFRKIGKTDIHISFDNKAAFIGECKIWHGEKLFQDAIQQVMNYATWRDTKVSLVIFNKDNQNVQGIIDKIDNWVSQYTKSHTRLKQNIWNCKYYRTDTQTEIALNVSVFDLYVDDTQIQDRRNK